jgi:hypothetical protein
MKLQALADWQRICISILLSNMDKSKTLKSSIFYSQIFNFTLLVVGILSFCDSSWGQLRTPQSSFSQLQGVSPLSDKMYFNALIQNYAPSTKSQKPPQKKYRKIELYGLKTVIKPIASGKRILAPKEVDLQDPYFKKLNTTIPGNLAPSQSETEVLRRFGDQAIQNWLNSPEVRNSGFGKTASRVENAMKVEASIKSAPLSPGGQAIDHKFSFQYLALQSQTKVEYKGWTNAMLRMDSGKNETAMEISERVLKNKDLVISHVKNPIENRSTMGLRWSW